MRSVNKRTVNKRKRRGIDTARARNTNPCAYVHTQRAWLHGGAGYLYNRLVEEDCVEHRVAALRTHFADANPHVAAAADVVRTGTPPAAPSLLLLLLLLLLLPLLLLLLLHPPLRPFALAVAAA